MGAGRPQVPLQAEPEGGGGRLPCCWLRSPEARLPPTLLPTASGYISFLGKFVGCRWNPGDLCQ